MTEKSYLWEGTTVGDATLAPYLKDAFNRWLFAQFVNNDTTIPFIVPGYLDDLQVLVSFGAINTLSIYPGAAIMNNHIYILDAVKHFSVDSIQDSTKAYRYDSVLLQLENNRVRLVLSRGAESTTYPPTALTLTQNSTTWQVELFRILVNSTSYVLEQKYVQDLRYFIPTNLYRNDNPKNLIRNSEFSMGKFSVGAILGAGWWGDDRTGTTTYTTAAKLSPQVRGYSVEVANCVLNKGMFQWFYLRGNSTFSVEGLIEPQNAASDVLVTLDGCDASFIVLETKEVIVPGQAAPATTRVRFTYTFENPDVVYLRLSIKNATTAGATYRVGQFVVSEGYFTGGLRPFHEVLMSDIAITSTSWDGDAKSTGTTTIDLASAFGPNIPAYIRGIILTLQCRDSGSAGAADVNLRVQSVTGAIVHGQCQIGRVTNDKWRTCQVIVPIDDDFRKSGSITQWRFVIGVTATGAATLDAFVQLVGVIT